jgi:hypothetical protein
MCLVYVKLVDAFRVVKFDLCRVVPRAHESPYAA